MKSVVHPRDLILFQGDSITDCGRNASPDGLGGGYVAMVRGMLRALHPELPVRILNRGNGGDRTAELLARWRPDCLDLKPDVLSIKIGVNDLWRKRGEWNGQTWIPLPQYRENMVKLLDQAKGAGIRQLVLMSPTTIDPQNDGELTVQLEEYAAAVRDLAVAYEALYVPSREVMLSARRDLPEVTWTGDGCHPGAAGHALLAATWLKAAGLLR